MLSRRVSSLRYDASTTGPAELGRALDFHGLVHNCLASSESASYFGTSKCVERSSCTAVGSGSGVAYWLRVSDLSHSFQDARGAVCIPVFRLQQQFVCTCCVSGPAREAAAVLVSPFCSRSIGAHASTDFLLKLKFGLHVVSLRA
jgi:hypothetical protein